MTGDRLDCLVIGYHDPPFADHERRVMARDPRFPERRMFMREHLRVDGRRMPYMDVINHFRADAGYLHVAEMPNLAGAYLASFLGKHGLDAEFVSLFGAERDRIAAILADRAPRVIAITTTFYVVPWPVVDVVRFLRERIDGAWIVVGGPLVDNLVQDLDPEALADTFTLMDADAYVHESQGEHTLARLVAALKTGTAPEAVPNLYLPYDGDWRPTGAVAEANSLDEYAVDWSRFDELGPTVQTRTARSCAYKCAFCDYPIRAGGLSLAAVETVEAELRVLDRRGVRNVVFIDDTFNVPGPRFKDLCRMMIRNDFGFEWFSYFRAAAARDEETYDLMRDSRCRGVFLGIESGSDRILAGMSKVATAERYRTGIERLHDRGISTFASFIVGFPGETEESVAETATFINTAAPTFVRAEPWWYNHRSPIHRQAEAYDIRGQGYTWSHATMDIDGACDALDGLFAAVDGSAWMPAYNFDFWALPYLLGKGLTVEEIVAFHRLAGAAMARNADPEPDPAPIDGIARLLAGAKLVPSRFPAGG